MAIGAAAAAGDQALVGIPLEFEQAVGVLSMNEVAGTVEAVAGAFVFTAAFPGGIVAGLACGDAGGESIAGRVVEETLDAPLRVGVGQDAAHRVVKVGVDAKAAVFPAREVADGVVVVIGGKQGLLAHVGVLAGEWRKRLITGHRPDQARLGGFVPIQVEPLMVPRVGCTVLIDGGLRLECAALPKVEWLAALAAQLAGRGR